MEIDKFIVLLLEEKSKELQKFKDSIESSELFDKKITYKEWKKEYLNWASKKEEGSENTRKIPRILLSND